MYIDLSIVILDIRIFHLFHHTITLKQYLMEVLSLPQKILAIKAPKTKLITLHNFVIEFFFYKDKG